MLPVAGLAQTPPEFRAALRAMCERNGWDASAVAAVMSIETGGTFAADAGWQNWSPRRTAMGLIQFVEATARGLGVEPSFVPPHYAMLTAAEPGSAWATWTVSNMTRLEQLELVERFFQRAFSGKPPTRPVDYYLATFVAAPGLPLSTVLATRGDRIYEANRGLDRDDSGRIEVADLQLTIERVLDAARERSGNSSDPKGFGGFALELVFGWCVSRLVSPRRKR